MDIAIDFDGTVVTHEYPQIGLDIGAIPVLQALVIAGHNLILNTMRSGKELEEAVTYLVDRGVILYGINRNPTQRDWTTSPKVYAELYIDDAALGVPLVRPRHLRPHVDWAKVLKVLREQEVLSDADVAMAEM